MSMEIAREGDQVKIHWEPQSVDVVKLSDADKERLRAHIEAQEQAVSMSAKAQVDPREFPVGYVQKETSWKVDGKLCLTTTAHVQALLGRRITAPGDGGGLLGG